MQARCRPGSPQHDRSPHERTHAVPRTNARAWLCQLTGSAHVGWPESLRVLTPSQSMACTRVTRPGAGLHSTQCRLTSCQDTVRGFLVMVQWLWASTPDPRSESSDPDSDRRPKRCGVVHPESGSESSGSESSGSESAESKLAEFHFNCGLV